MSRVFVLHAPDKQTLVAFARSYGLFRRLPPLIDNDVTSPTFGEVLEEGGWVPREGFQFAAWNDSGEFVTSNKELRTTLTVEVVQEGVDAIPAEVDEEGNETAPAVPAVPAEFAFRVGANLPKWVDEQTMAYEGEASFRGRYVRKQGPMAVFSGVATVGEELGIFVPAREVLPGFVYKILLSDGMFKEDQEDVDEAEEGQARRSKLVRWAKRNGTIEKMAGGQLDVAVVDGVRIFKPDQVAEWLAARGIPNCVYGGSEVY